jgi:hypothetical protein
MRWSAGIIFCLIFFIFNCVQAQRAHYGLIKGTVIDSLSKRGLESASIMVYVTSDSLLVDYALSNRNGTFAINKIPFDTECKLVVTAKGYYEFFMRFILSLGDKEKQLDTIRLVQLYNELKTVTVTATRLVPAMKKDTLEFNVSSFKTMPNAMVEDLLRQLPGVEIDKDGNITISGKKVTKLMVNGREFFGGDPKIAIKNLPKDVIDKLQVLDNRSREAQFNNTTSSNENLAINLTLKRDVQKGWFGRVSAGYGSKERYESNAMVNFFRDSKQLNFIANSNNTNRGSISNNDVNMSNTTGTLNSSSEGLVHSKSGGVNFNNDVGKQMKLSGSYYYNNNHTNNFVRIHRQTMIHDTTNIYDAVNDIGNDYNHHSLSLGVHYNIDSATNLNVNAYMNCNLIHEVIGNNAISKDEMGQLLNTGENNYSSHGRDNYISSMLFFSHRFRKLGRGFTLGMNYNYNDVASKSYNIGQNDFYKTGGLDSVSQLNQKSFASNKGYILSLIATYSEPVNKYITILFKYNYNPNRNLSDKTTYQFNNVTNKYDIEDAGYTDAFRNTLKIHSPDVSFSFRKNKFSYEVGWGIQFLEQDNLSINTGSVLHENYINFTPWANFRYQISKTSVFLLYYHGANQQPSLQQLQPVPDNRNPLFVQLGNPNLRPSFFQTINAQLRQSKASNYLFSNLNVYTAHNQIVQETWFDSFGKQVSQPININGNFGGLCDFQYSRTWKNRNITIRMNFASSGKFSRNNFVVNQVKVSSNGYDISQSVSLSFMYKQLLSVIPSFSIRYNKIDYSSVSTQNANFNIKTFSVGAFWNCLKRLIIENNLQYNYNNQIAKGFSKNGTILSTAVNCLLFNKQQGVVRLAVYDILKQNAGVSRSITENYIEDKETQVLRRYFLLSFVYNLKKSKIE